MTRCERYLNHLQRFGIQPGLERIHALLARLGEPQRSYPHILVGGTNGKGSTCEYLARMLAANGEKVGLFTSPHIYRWNERMRVVHLQNPAPNTQHLFPGAISDDDLDALFDAALPHLEAVTAELGQPTEFETLTALGFWHFARQKVDCAVIEVGLGGKWDATNAGDPFVSVITHVALDHCDRLGHSREEIALDKVEIARPGRVLVTAERRPEILDIFESHCEIYGARLVKTPKPSVSNDFQQINLRTAETALREFNAARGKPVKTPSVCANVPGRYEVIGQNPRFILDVCNNPDGAASLAAALTNDPQITTGPQGNLILVLGILADKEFAEMVAILAPLARVVIATQSHSPRAARADAIAAAAKIHCPNVSTVTPVIAAVRHAIQLSQCRGSICLAGSFTTVGEVDRSLFASQNDGE